MVVQHLEQRRVAEAALDLQAFDQTLERQILVALGRAGGFADIGQQLGDGHLRVELGAQHLGVDEYANQPLDFFAIAVGDRHPDTDVLQATVMLQKQLETGQQHTEQGDPLLTRQARQALAQALWHRDGQALALAAGMQRARVVGRQLQYRVLVAQLGLPVSQLSRLLPGLQPTPLPQRIVTVLDRQLRQHRHLPANQGVVAVDEFLDEHVHRPAVGDDMVQGQQQHMLLCRQLQQAYAKQRALLEVEGQTGFVPHRLRDGGVAGLGGQRLKVVFFNDDGRWLHHLHHVVTLGLEHSTQGLVTLQYLLERALYRRGVQRPFQHHRTGQVVGGTVWVQLPQKPHALLGIGQCMAIVDGDVRRDREL
ncbi:hypothetical protein D3C76_233220 [compost metagenome]